MPLLLISLIAAVVVANLWGWIGVLVLGVTATGVFFLVVLVASRQADKKFERDNRDLSGEAERIAVLHGISVDEDSSSEKYAEQGRELYEYYRRKGLNSEESLDAVRDYYDRELDEFEQDRIAGITRR